MSMNYILNVIIRTSSSLPEEILVLKCYFSNVSEAAGAALVINKSSCTKLIKMSLRQLGHIILPLKCSQKFKTIHKHAKYWKKQSHCSAYESVAKCYKFDFERKQKPVFTMAYIIQAHKAVYYTAIHSSILYSYIQLDMMQLHRAVSQAGKRPVYSAVPLIDTHEVWTKT